MSTRSANKFRNVPTTVDNYDFDSLGEAERYIDLKLMQQAGVISDLVCDKKQLVFVLLPAFVDTDGEHQRSITMEVDFTYVEDGRKIAEDFKGIQTDVFKIKAKLFRWRHGKEWTLRVTTARDLTARRRSRYT
jgi:Protein of unknown function (DUF1064)